MKATQNKINPDTKLSELVGASAFELLNNSEYTNFGELKLALLDGSFKLNGNKKYNPKTITEITNLTATISLFGQMVDTSALKTAENKVEVLMRSNDDQKESFERYKEGAQIKYEDMVIKKNEEITARGAAVKGLVKAGENLVIQVKTLKASLNATELNLKTLEANYKSLEASSSKEILEIQLEAEVSETRKDDRIKSTGTVSLGILIWSLLSCAAVYFFSDWAYLVLVIQGLNVLVFLIYLNRKKNEG